MFEISTYSHFQQFIVHYDGDYISILEIDSIGNQKLVAYLTGPDVGPKSWPSEGSNWEKKILSSSNNKILVEFRSDERIVSKGFSATIQFTKLHSQKCESWVDMNNKTLLSPKYPHTYNSNASCNWLITVRHGFHITLDFIEFNVSSF